VIDFELVFSLSTVEGTVVEDTNLGSSSLLKSLSEVSQNEEFFLFDLFEVSGRYS
jgi:hypothetical protein